MRNKTIVDISEFLAKVKDGKRPKTAVRLATSGEATIANDARVATFVFSDNSVDRYGDTIDARGWVLDNFNANPIALFGHDSSSVENVIGRAKNVRVQGNQLIGDIEFMPAETNPTAEAVYQMVKGGWLKTVSVGFQPLDWAASKDKSRPGGVDFKKQELLEISIVPIPANPNALGQARAAGVDVDRLALIQLQAPSVSKKGLYEVSALARLLSELGYLEDMVEWEAEYEGDGSDIAQRITDAMKVLGQILVDMTVEEVGELFAEEDGADPAIVVSDPVVMESLTPAQKAIVVFARAILSPARRSVQTVNLNIELTPEARAILGSLERAGKVLSSVNEKALRDAHEAITKGCDVIKGVVDAATADDVPDVVAAAARAKRERRIRALKLQTE